MAKFQRINTPVGEAVYPHLNSKDTKFVAEGEYHTKLRVVAEDAEGLVEKLEEIRDEFVAEQIKEDAKKKKWTIAPVVEEELDDEGEETGKVILKTKLKAHVTTKDGKEWDQEPAIFDSGNTRVEDISKLRIFGGSKLRLNCDVVPYAMSSTKTFGVSLRLRAVQIVELVQGGGSPFDEVEGGERIDEPVDSNPFDGGDDDANDNDDF